MEFHADGKSFAEMMSTFAKLTTIQEQIDAVLRDSRVPPSEVRKFLAVTGTAAVKSTPVYEYLRYLFDELDLGRLEVLYADRYEYVFGVADGTVPDLFPDVEGQPVCLPIVDFFARFFSEDMGLDADVQETQCVKVGGSMCEFTVGIKPLALYPYLVTEDDRKILSMAIDRSINVNFISKEMSLDPEYVISRLEHLQDLGLLNRDNTISSGGKAALKYIEENTVSLDEFPPPWNDYARIRNLIAGASSLAEALKEIAEDEELPWEEDTEAVIELKEKAEKSKSFAELLANLEEDEE